MKALARLTAIGVAIVLVLVACGTGTTQPPSTVSLSGTVAVPGGRDASNTVVSLCQPGSACTGSGLVAEVLVNSSGTASPTFAFNNIAAQSYDLFARAVQDTFPVTYLEGERRGVTAPGTVVIPLALTGLPETGSLSGTVNSGGSSSVAGTTVYLCLPGVDCSAGGSVVTPVTVTTDAPQGAFSFANVPAGTYQLVAVGPAPFLPDNSEVPPVIPPANRQFGSLPNVSPPDAGLQLNMDLQVIAPVDGTAIMSGTIRYPGALGASTDDAGEGVSLSAEFVPVSVPEAEIVPGQLVVRFDPTVIRSQADLAVMNVNGFTLRLLGEAGTDGFQLYEAAGASDEETIRLAHQVRAQPGVLSAAPNWVLHSFAAPNDTYYPIQWHYGAMNLEAAWNVTTGSNSVTVAIVDSGSIAHPDLTFVQGYDFISDPTSAGDGGGRDNDPTDLGDGSGYHGAHVAGTIGAKSNNSSGVAGVNWNVNLLPIRALGKDGSGSFIDILDGIAWAAGMPVAGTPANANPARVINLSLGADIGVTCREAMGGDDSFFTNLANSGVILVVAAGNSNINAVGTFPANCPGVITVGATGPDHSRAPYSNYGPDIDVMGPGGDTGKYIQVGTEYYPAGVLSTVLAPNGDDAYDFMQGTSMAAPHIAGVVALMLAQTPGLTFNQVLANLKSSTWHGSCGTADCGAGLVDAYAAVMGGGTAPPPTPPTSPGTGEGVTTVIDFYRLIDGVYEWGGWVEFRDIELLVIDYMVWDIPSGTYRVHGFQNLNGYDAVDGYPYWDAGEPQAILSGVILPPNTHVGNQDLTLQSSF